jgi:hypothetical protein
MLWKALIKLVNGRSGKAPEGGVLYPSGGILRPASSWTFDRPRREMDPDNDPPVD